MLDSGDRAYIHEVSVNAASEVSKKLIEDLVKWHISSCPHGRTIYAVKWSVIGACIVSAIGGGTAMAALLKVIGP